MRKVYVKVKAEFDTAGFLSPLSLTWEDSLLDYLVKKSYSAVYGARNLRRQVQKDLEDPIATKIIESYMSPITQLKASANDSKIELLAL